MITIVREAMSDLGWPAYESVCQPIAARLGFLHNSGLLSWLQIESAVIDAYGGDSSIAPHDSERAADALADRLRLEGIFFPDDRPMGPITEETGPAEAAWLEAHGRGEL